MLHTRRFCNHAQINTFPSVSACPSPNLVIPTECHLTDVSRTTSSLALLPAGCIRLPTTKLCRQHYYKARTRHTRHSIQIHFTLIATERCLLYNSLELHGFSVAVLDGCFCCRFCTVVINTRLQCSLDISASAVAFAIVSTSHRVCQRRW